MLLMIMSVLGKAMSVLRKAMSVMGKAMSLMGKAPYKGITNKLITVRA